MVLGVGQAVVLGCEGCFNFQISNDHADQIGIAFVIVGIASGLGVPALVVRACLRAGPRRVGSLVSAVGLMLLPFAFVPLVRTANFSVVNGEARAHDPRSGASVTCDQAIFGITAYEGRAVSETAVVAADACRDNVRRSFWYAALLALMSSGCLVGGALIARRPGRARSLEVEAEHADGVAAADLVHDVVG